MNGYWETPVYQIIDTMENKNDIYVMRDDLIPYSLGGNKVRIADEFLKDMKLKGCDAMVAYGNVRSNLCRVIASRCHNENIPCYILSSTEAHEEEGLENTNGRCMQLFQAHIVPCDKNNVSAGVEKMMKELEEAGHKPYYIYGNKFGEGNEGVSAAAYAKAYQAIKKYESVCGKEFDYIFHASGTGATQAGLVCGHILAEDHAKVVGISISSREYERAFSIIRKGVKECLKTMGRSYQDVYDKEIIWTDVYKCGGYGQYDKDIIQCIRTQLQVNALPLDPVYTGKAFWGMQSYIREKDISGRNILFIHTGGTPMFYDYLHGGKII